MYANAHISTFSNSQNGSFKKTIVSTDGHATQAVFCSYHTKVSG